MAFAKVPPTFSTKKSTGSSGFKPTPVMPVNDPPISEISDGSGLYKFNYAPKPPTPAEEKEKQAMIENDIMYRTMTGHSQKDYDAVLGSSTTGYQDPAASNLTSKHMTPKMLASVLTHKMEEKPSASAMDQTDQAIAYANTFKPGTVSSDPRGIFKIDDPEEAANEVIRRAQTKFRKFNPDDPRWDEIRENFKNFVPQQIPETASKPESLGIMDIIKNAATGLVGGVKNMMPASKGAAGSKDQFGFTMGEVRDVPGKGTFKYSGNDKWLPVQ